MFSRSRLADLWDRLNTSYWFVPAIMFSGALVLAAATFTLDLWLQLRDSIPASPWFPRFSADGARSILSMLASGMLTVTGVVFSLTVVALQLASSQFGPRLLRAFMTSRGTQVVLGTFTSSFVYDMLLAGTVRKDIDFVPQVSTATGILLGAVDIGVLIFFVHHLATSIRIETLLANIGRELGDVIDALYPAEIGEGGPPTRALGAAGIGRDADPCRIRARRAGYIRDIDGDMLMETASRHDLLVALEHRPGDFVVEGSVLMRVAPADSVDETILKRLEASVVIGSDRTPRQDPGFAVRQFVEVALRALSPGINDPFTAIECIDRLTEALCTVARRPHPSAFRFDDDGTLRVIAPRVSLQELVELAFDPIARAGGGNGDVAAQLLGALDMIGACARDTDDQEMIRSYAGSLEEQMLAQLPLERDRCRVTERATGGRGDLGGD